MSTSFFVIVPMTYLLPFQGQRSRSVFNRRSRYSIVAGEGGSTFCMIILLIESIKFDQYDLDLSWPLIGQKGQNRFLKVKLKKIQRSRSFSTPIRFSDSELFLVDRAHRARHFDTKHYDLWAKAQGQAWRRFECRCPHLCQLHKFIWPSTFAERS